VGIELWWKNPASSARDRPLITVVLSWREV
jgi:hypothetical protein